VFLTHDRFKPEIDALASEFKIEAAAAATVIYALKVLTWPTTLKTRAG
jgi:hypothetical protein